MFAHMFDDVAITDLGAGELQLPGFQKALEAQIGHDGRDDAAGR